MIRASRRTLQVVSADTTILERQSAAPRRDYDAIRQHLETDLLAIQHVRRSPVGRLLMRVLGAPAALAWCAFRRRASYGAILTDAEHVGLILALLLKMARATTVHVTIGHRITAMKKRPFFRWLHVQSHIDRLAVHAHRQVELGIADLRIQPEKLALVPYQVDTEFWSPGEASEERLVCSAGLEFRDYPTLLRAVDGMDAAVVIGAASYYSRRSNTARDTALPSNVQIGAFNYEELRNLYRRAAVVVVPLHDVDFQAGVTTILEAMAVGKPVIVTHTQGQTDVVIDRRAATRFPHGERRHRPISLFRLLAAESGVTAPPNGFYVPPADSGALRSAIYYLLDHPEERRSLGEAGRALVQRVCSVDQFAERLSQLIQEARARRGMAERACGPVQLAEVRTQ